MDKEEIEADGITMELLHDLKEHNNRMDEYNKRLTSALKTAFIAFGATVILIIAMFYFGMLHFLNQYEFENYSQDGSGYNNINTGEQGGFVQRDRNTRSEKSKEHVKRHVSSCTAPGQVIYQDFKVSGRMLRPHQGDTVSPRRGLNIPTTD